MLSCICFWLGQVSMEQVLFIWQASMEQLTLLVSFVLFFFSFFPLRISAQLVKFCCGFFFFPFSFKTIFISHSMAHCPCDRFDIL